MSSPEQQYQLQQLREQMQAQMMQAVVSNMTEACFKKCTNRSGKQLDSREQNCAAMCMDRYMESMEVVSKALADRT